MTEVTLHDSGLSVPLPTGTAYFNYYWLRDNCESSFDPQTRERIFDICALSTPPVAVAAHITGEDTLCVDWRDEAHQSEFQLSWLARWHRDGRRPDSARIRRRHWYADHYPNMVRVDFQTVLHSPEQRLTWAHALLEEGVAIVDGMPNSDEALTELAQSLGRVRPSVAGDYFDVRVHIDPVNLSYTAAELEMHTDTPAEELPPGVQFLHCRANSVAGGNSLFLDGAAVAEDFRQQYPEDFELLANTRVPFFYEHEAFDWRARQRVIELDEQGAVAGLSISQHMADTFDLPQDLLDAYYPAFVRFIRALREEKYLMTFRLNAGECIVFDNHRIVHGREAYTADSGERYLRGCYVDRGELRSTYRTLQRQCTSM